MGLVRFYHLTQAPVEVTLPKLLARALDAKLRVQVRCVKPERAEWFDQKLWLDDGDGFLPHGLAGGPHDALQPVLLGVDDTLLPGVRCLMSLDGAPVEAAEIAVLDRALILFDGHDADATAHARGQWKALTGAGVAAEYWSEESGRWELKASAGAPSA